MLLISLPHPGAFDSVFFHTSMYAGKCGRFGTRKRARGHAVAKASNNRSRMGDAVEAGAKPAVPEDEERLSSNGDDAINQARSCAAVYAQLREPLRALSTPPFPAQIGLEHFTRLRHLLRKVRARQPVGFKWKVLSEEEGFQRTVGAFVKHVDRTLAGKARDLLQDVDAWVFGPSLRVSRE